jgi:hypothetical protein
MLTSDRTRTLALVCVLSTSGAWGAGNPTLSADFGTKSGGCPATAPTQSTTYTMTVTGINDVVVDFNSGSKYVYGLQIGSSPMVTSVTTFFGTTQAAAACPVQMSALPALYAAIRSKVNGHPKLNPPPGVHVPLKESLDAANNIPEVLLVQDAINSQSCNFPSDLKDHPIYKWIQLLSGDHSVTFSPVLGPNETYVFSIVETRPDPKASGNSKEKSTAKMRWVCGDTDLISASIGPLVTTLPARSYNSQSAPLPAGSSTTQNILSVGNNSNINVLAAGLVNVHLPTIQSMPWAGLAFSAGPVYQLGNNSPSVSSLGVFFGLSAHLFRAVYLTPGVHIGQFADFPAGFYPGAVIPSGFGTLTPVKRDTAHFAIGITFRTSIKKSSTNTGSGGSTGGTGSTQQSNGAAPNQQTGGNPPGGAGH